MSTSDRARRQSGNTESRSRFGPNNETRRRQHTDERIVPDAAQIYKSPAPPLMMALGFFAFAALLFLAGYVVPFGTVLCWIGGDSCWGFVSVPPVVIMLPPAAVVVAHDVPPAANLQRTPTTVPQNPPPQQIMAKKNTDGLYIVKLPVP